MKGMRLPIFFIINILFNSFCSDPTGYEKKIKISFFIDDSTQQISDQFKVDFISGIDTLHGTVEKNYLILPLPLNDTSYDVAFSWSQHFLLFRNVAKSMIIPDQDIEWRFGIDNRPFNNLRGLLPYDEFLSDTVTKRLIYFQFDPMEYGTGVQFVQKER